MSQPTPSGNPVRALGHADAYTAPTIAFTEREGQVHVAMRAVDGSRTQVIQGFFDREAVEGALTSHRMVEPAA